MANVINKISNEMKEKIKKKSILTAPNNPTERGMSPTTIKKLLTDPVVADKDSIISEINRIVDEINLYVKFSESSDADYATFIGLLNEVKNDINTNKTDISTLKSSVSSLRTTVSSFSGRINTNANDIQTILGLVGSLENRVNTLEKTQAEGGGSGIKDVSYNIQTGIFTFTKQNGTIFEVDLAIEKVVTNFVYNKQKNALELTLGDGTVQSIPMSDFASAYEGVENDQIQVSIQSGNKIQAILKDGSVTNAKLDNNTKGKLNKVVKDFNYVSDEVELGDLNLKDLTIIFNETLLKTDGVVSLKGIGNCECTFNNNKYNFNSCVYYPQAIIMFSNHSETDELLYPVVSYMSGKWNLLDGTNENGIDIESPTITNFDFPVNEYIYNGVTKTSDDLNNNNDFRKFISLNTKLMLDPNAEDSNGILLTLEDKSVKFISSDKITKKVDREINVLKSKITSLEQNQGSGGSGSGGTVFETQQIDIAVSDWTELPDSEPYTYFANVTLSKSLDNAISIELINNDPIVFAKFGFAIGQVTAVDELEIYSIGNPDGNVTLTFETVSQTSSVNLISFTIDGTQYSAEEGMTWEEWCNSNYNTYGYVIDNYDGYIAAGGGHNYVAFSDSLVESDDVIINNRNYTHHDIGTGGGN